MSFVPILGPWGPEFNWNKLTISCKFDPLQVKWWYYTFSSIKMEEYVEPGLSDIFWVKMVAKNIVLESPGTHFMHIKVNVPLWIDSRKATYSQVHGSPVLKALSLKILNWISATILATLIRFGQDPKLRTTRTFWRENLVFPWRRILYFNLTYIFPLASLFIS